jgi:hypothetical protein
MKISIDYKPGKPVPQPEDIWGVEDAYADAYDEKVKYGIAEARRQKIAIVAIARNAMPRLRNTLRLVGELASLFKDAVFFCFENDSDDGTAATLDEWAAARGWAFVTHDTLGGEDARGFQPERTVRLAKCRTKCQEWVRQNAADAGYVMVLDADPHGGFSIPGVLNSLGWFCELRGRTGIGLEPGAMASSSLFIRQEESGYGIAQYDAWAARLNTFEDRRDHAWFHVFMPPAGSPPIPFYSAFGGLCLYTRYAFLAGRYEGGDCEHVAFHRTMRQAGYQLYLNPGSRYVAILP